MARTLTDALKNYLSLPGAPAPAGNRAFMAADLFEFTVAGTTYYRTNFDRDLTGVAPATVTTYTSSGAVLPRVRLRQTAGLSVDDLELDVGHGGTATLGAKTWVRRALDGDLDKAPLRLFRAFLDPTTFAVVGTVLLFDGQISDMEPGAAEMRLVATVSTKEFNASFPKVLVEPNCIWDLGSTDCGFAGTLNYTATLTAGSTASLLNVATVPGGLAGAYLFFQGAAQVAGLWRLISNAGDTPTPNFTVSPPFPAGVVEGLIGSAGALTVRRGCAKTPGWCATYFSNIAHYLGAPNAPTAKEAT
ncbi:MAG: DUF2163 domain-containing protein [Deltaproteobacteria bacterium]